MFNTKAIILDSHITVLDSAPGWYRCDLTGLWSDCYEIKAEQDGTIRYYKVNTYDCEDLVNGEYKV